jgi:hypothetical protein
MDFFHPGDSVIVGNCLLNNPDNLQRYTEFMNLSVFLLSGRLPP